MSSLGREQSDRPGSNRLTPPWQGGVLPSGLRSQDLSSAKHWKVPGAGEYDDDDPSERIVSSPAPVIPTDVWHRNRLDAGSYAEGDSNPRLRLKRTELNQAQLSAHGRSGLRESNPFRAGATLMHSREDRPHPHITTESTSRRPTRIRTPIRCV